MRPGERQRPLQYVEAVIVAPAYQVHAPGTVPSGDVLNHRQGNRLSSLDDHRELQRFISGQCRIQLFS